jgi:Metallo-beta-lactamase superfamily
MANYSIWVLEYSYVPNYHVSGIIYGYHNQGYRKLPYYYVLIKGKHHAAMVDVGYNHKEFGGYLGDKFGVINWHSPSEVLKECSLRPEDIDTVFVTHAHFDHFGNVDDFPKAKFYIREREIAGYLNAGPRAKLSSNPRRRTHCRRYRLHPLLGRHALASQNRAHNWLYPKNTSGQCGTTWNLQSRPHFDSGTRQIR